MNRRLVVVVPCSAKKASGLALPAGERYVGTFHTYARKHAERLGADVLILSAAYGLLELRTLIPDYEMTLADAGSIATDTGPRRLADQAGMHGLNDPNVVVVSFCPAKYSEQLAAAVPALVTPLAGSRGIGQQRGRIRTIELSDLPGFRPEQLGLIV